MKTGPFATIAITALALAVCVSPGGSDLCIFDREAILRGEWWRVATGHLVHFSQSHLFFDAIVFLVAGSLVEFRNRRLFFLLGVATAVSIGVALLAFAPGMRFYGGLSGIATAMLFLSAVQSAEQKGLLRVTGVLVAVIVIAKLLLEALSDRSLFVRFDSPSIHPAPFSHAVGTLVATGVWLVSRHRARHAVTA
jgi:rhomboid family GlyGly-CTERM serine protease